MPPIPQRFLKEFLINPRLKGLSPKGTRPADLAVMKRVIQETLAKPEVLQDFANFALKNGEFRMR